ncbi:MAG TPA: hypothetical protein VMS09_15910 [Paenibacillus sp.]|nr:hypothetical protein [Paenibacillus sp.]
MNASFYILLFSQTSTKLGFALYTMVVIMFVYNSTGSTTLPAAVTLISFVARMISSMILPLFLHRYRLNLLIRRMDVRRHADCFYGKSRDFVVQRCFDGCLCYFFVSSKNSTAERPNEHNKGIDSCAAYERVEVSFSPQGYPRSEDNGLIGSLGRGNMDRGRYVGFRERGAPRMGVVVGIYQRRLLLRYHCGRRGGLSDFGNH